VSKLLGKELRAALDASDGSEKGLPCWSTSEGRSEAIRSAFLKLDKGLSWKEAAYGCGSTCIVGMIWPDYEEGAELGEAGGTSSRVVLANLGDSRGLVARAGHGGLFSSVELLGETTDHKPDSAAERRRIVEAGGSVTGGGLFPARVDGDLALSRAFGDFRLKAASSLPPEAQKVSPMPDIYEISCRRGDAIVLACDGAFDVLSSQQVADIACADLAKPRDIPEGAVPGPGGNPMLAAKAVVMESLRRGTLDNVTCVVVYL
jgi:serine/threonine protein phosphatase PrpC